MSGNLKPVLSYANKIMLAPMVRVGTLPMRIMALRYGADIVYGEEIIDHKLVHCTRIENQLLGTIDYVASDGTILFRTCEEEKQNVIFQMGTCDPDRALKAARMLENDVSGIDINMGCPKEFSIKGGMGAALLTQPEKIKKILTTLIAGLSIPVTCKIRILPELSDTLELVKLIEKTGVKAIGIHGRWKEERSSLPCHYDYIKKITECVNIPIIANGGSLDIKTYDDIDKFKKDTNCSSVMIARSAISDPSIFRNEGSLPIMDVTKEYLKLAVEFESPFQNVKYVMCKILGDMTRDDVRRQVQASRDIQDICIAYNVEDYRQTLIGKREVLKEKLRMATEGPDAKRQKLDNGIIIMDVTYNRKIYPKTVSPAQILFEYCREKFQPPVYNSIISPDKMYKCELNINGKVYVAQHFERRKKSAEQASAIVFLKHHDIYDGRVKT